MEIKQATPNEFVEVLFLLRECIKDMENKGFKQWEFYNPRPSQLNEDIESKTIYLLKELGIARGMMKLTGETPSEYEDVNWKNSIDKPLYIKLFAIHPIWQNSDTSEKMIEFAEIFAKENSYSGIRLDVLNNYPVTNGFFESKQFIMSDSFLSASQKTPYICYEKNL